MLIIRSMLESFDHERGRNLPCTKLEFAHLWAIGLFTSDGDFCSQFQNDLRDSSSGCKWRQMEISFQNGLECLRFAQKMCTSIKRNFSFVNIINAGENRKMFNNFEFT